MIKRIGGSWLWALASATLICAMSGCTNNPFPPGESKGNVLYLNFGEDPKSLDPTFSYSTGEAKVLDVINTSYFRYHYLKQSPVRLELNLGARLPVRKLLANGGESWTFSIRKDLRFQDDPCFTEGKGREITAADFVYSFKRMADPKIGYPLSGILEDNVVDWKAFAKGFRTDRHSMADPNYDKPFAGVTVDPQDPYAFTILLKRPYPQLRYLMAMHHTSPQAREAVEFYNDEYARHPVGCGPYRLLSYVPKQRIVLTRNLNAVKGTYPAEGDPGDNEAGLLADAGKSLPLTDTIVYSMIRESTSSWNLFLQGYLDETVLSSNNFQQAMGTNGALSPAMSDLGIKLRRTPQSAFYYISFNMNDPLWGGYTRQKQNLRQAISLALDSNEFIDLALQGNATSAEWILPPGIFGNDPSYNNPYGKTNLTRAKQLLEAAGYPGGKDPRTGEYIILNIDSAATTAAARSQYAILKRQIGKLGVKVEHRPTNANMFRDKLIKCEQQCILYGWFADYPDAENFVFLLYGQNGGLGKPNYTQYKNPRYDALFEKMRDMDDSPDRKKLLCAMRDIAVEDCAMIPFYHPQSVSMAHTWLTNTKEHPISYDLLAYKNVDNTLRAARQRAWNQPVWWPLAAFVVLSIAGIIPAGYVIKRRVNRHLRSRQGSS